MRLDVPYREICSMPVSLIDSLLSKIEEPDWHVSNYRKSAGNMPDTDSIPILHTPLCASGLCNDRPIAEIKEEPLYRKFINEIQPILNVLREHFEFDKHAMFIARLRPHGTIGMHPDVGNFLTKCHRVHVPLQTNPLVAYRIEDQEYYWQKGKVYEFDNTLVHGVFNRSDEYRIHLVVNLYPQGCTE